MRVRIITRVIIIMIVWRRPRVQKTMTSLPPCVWAVCGLCGLGCLAVCGLCGSTCMLCSFVDVWGAVWFGSFGCVRRVWFQGCVWRALWFGSLLSPLSFLLPTSHPHPHPHAHVHSHPHRHPLRFPLLLLLLPPTPTHISPRLQLDPTSAA